jgi:polyadenylation factor subunit 2
VDHFCSSIHHVKTRLYRRVEHEYHVPPHLYYCKDLLPLQQTTSNPSTALCTQWANTIAAWRPGGQAATGRRTKQRVSIEALAWSPTGRRLVAATSTSEFLLYNGHSFSPEPELRINAHEDSAVSAIAWGPSDDIILSGDKAGVVKLWHGFTPCAVIKTHHEQIREVSWAPGEYKFVTAGKDSTARVWDTQQALTENGQNAEEGKFQGHGGDVHTVEWHKSMSLIATGSQGVKTAR